MSRFMAHPVHATPLPEPERSVLYRAAEFLTLVATLAVICYLIFFWLPGPPQ